MSKIIYLGIPAHGHLNPTLPVVQELVRRGEQVLYYNTEEFRPQIERAGALFRAYPETELTSTKISKAVEKGNLANATGLILRVTESLVPFVAHELRDEQPDLVIFDSLAMWGKIATRLLKVRAAGSISHFVFDVRTGNLTGREIGKMLWQYLPTLLGVMVSRIRLARHYGKAFPSSNPLFPMRDNLNLIFTSRELNPNSPVIDESFRFVGPSINPHIHISDFPFADLKAGKIIYISLGTVHHASAEFYQGIFQTFSDYPAQFIVSVGQQMDIAVLGAIPPNFMVRPSVPQLEILRHADLFITHGGMNSVHEGLYYGVPLVVIPQQIEQLLNARCFEAQGVAVVLDTQVWRGKLAMQALRHAVEQVFAEAKYRTAAQKVQQMLRATGGYQQAADEIQTYLAGEKS